MSSFYYVTESEEAYKNWLEDKNLKRKKKQQGLKTKQQLEKLLNEIKLNKQKCNEDAYEKWLAEKNRQKKEQENKQQLILKLEKLQKEVKVQLQIQKHKAWVQEKKQLVTKQLQEDIERTKLKARTRHKKKMIKKNPQILKEWAQKRELENLYHKLVKKSIAAKKAKVKEMKRKAKTDTYKQWMEKSNSLPVPSNRESQFPNTSEFVNFLNPKSWVSNIQVKKQ